MNFLSHYILDFNDNIFHNIGLTLPDVIALHNHNVGIKAARVRELLLTTTNNDHLTMLNAMCRHFELDKIFHSSVFFKSSVNFIISNFENNTKDTIAFYYAHILLEIYLDRFVLEKIPTLNTTFYNEYKNFDFTKIVYLFENIKNFDIPKFLDFCILFANSDFLYGYNDKASILSSLHKVTKRMGLEIAFKSDDNIIVETIEDTYIKLKPQIDIFFNSLKKF